MEYVSFLAGERWSDHPKCTHPLLSGLARAINDHMSDVGRARLVPLIPSVVGLNGDDPRLDVGIATRCAVMALPVAAEFRQRALAAGLLAANQVFADLDHEIASSFQAAGLWDEVDRTLASAPHSVRWAESFVAGAPISAKVFTRRSAPNIVQVAVEGIAEACIPDPDDLLHDVLAMVIGDCSSWVDPERRSERPTEIPQRSVPPAELTVG